MKKTLDESAFPLLIVQEYSQRGLTKREYFAGLLMQALVSSDGRLNTGRAEDAVCGAEALLAELEKKQGENK